MRYTIRLIIEGRQNVTGRCYCQWSMNISFFKCIAPSEGTVAHCSLSKSSSTLRHAVSKTVMLSVCKACPTLVTEWLVLFKCCQIIRDPMYAQQWAILCQKDCPWAKKRCQCSVLPPAWLTKTWPFCKLQDHPWKYIILYHIGGNPQNTTEPVGSSDWGILNCIASFSKWSWILLVYNHFHSILDTVKWCCRWESMGCYQDRPEGSPDGNNDVRVQVA